VCQDWPGSTANTPCDTLYFRAIPPPHPHLFCPKVWVGLAIGGGGEVHCPEIWCIALILGIAHKKFAKLFILAFYVSCTSPTFFGLFSVLLTAMSHVMKLMQTRQNSSRACIRWQIYLGNGNHPKTKQKRRFGNTPKKLQQFQTIHIFIFQREFLTPICFRR